MTRRSSPLGRALDRVEVAELRSDLTALAQRVGQLAEQVAVLNERTSTMIHTVEKRDAEFGAMAKRVANIERAALVRAGKFAAYVTIGTVGLWLLTNVDRVFAAIKWMVKL